MNPQELQVGDRYNWRGQPERLIFIGCHHYFRDPRLWYEFALVEKPTVVWCEVLESDLSSFEASEVQA